MRFLKVIMAGLMAVVAILFGLFAAVVVAATALVAMVFRRGRRRSQPAVTEPTPGVRLNRRDDGEVIDVQATEMPERPSRS